MNLHELGFTKEELQQRVVDQLVQQLTETATLDEDGEPDFEDSAMYRRLNQAVKSHIDLRVSEIAEKHVLPRISEIIENLCLQETNRWGEKTGKKLTFIEYLVERAERYIQEEVNHSGKTKEQEGYGWNKQSTRIVYLIHEHLQYSIRRAMEEALGLATSSVKKGLEEAVKIAIDNIKVTVKTDVKT